MSLKKYFEITEEIKSLSGKTADEIGSQVESVGYHTQDIIEEERFIPRVDFSDPANFARYGSAAEYYDQSIKRIYNEYPYDGSLRERLEWQNTSTYIDLYVYNNLYPRTNGYVIVSADGWGTLASIEDGYGLPNDLEYISVKGGPNPNPNGMSPMSTQFTGSNYYEPDKNRASNLEFDLASRGASIEFWLNKTEFVTSLTEKEVIFDLWNGQNSSSAGYTRFRLELTGATDGTDPFRLTIYSGSTGFSQQAIAASTFTTASVADGAWHHYAVTTKSASAGVTTRFYVDGALNNETVLGTAGIDDMDNSSLRAYIGALVAPPSGGVTPSSALAGAGKLSGSLDELRYWKTQRSSKEIGRFWFTQVGGGVNTDPTPFTTTEESANVDLGVYFKFNEGITGIAATDSSVLDYSGRFSNGSWVGYTSNSRNTGSAIVLSLAAISEFKDPIIYSFNPAVVSLAAGLEISGSTYDVNNNAAIYNSIPSWITEEDVEGQSNVKHLTQIISSYFDTLHLQIESLNELKNVQYPSGSEKPLPFAEKLLSSYGFVAPEIFLDAGVLERLADRSEDRVYEKSLHDTKNIIYQNIYNNLNYIYKSKGTEKSFRNLIRCFGIDDELIKLNMYADNVEYELRNNRSNVIVADKFANFNTSVNTRATIYNYVDSSNVNSVGFVTSSVSLTGGYATTLETEILFPLKLEESSIAYANTNTISASLFGVHATVGSGTDTTWASTDTVNLQVYAVRDEIASTNVKFVLTGTAGGYVPEISSSLYEDVYNNTNWNLSVRIRPDQYPLDSFVAGTNSDYVVELHGVQADSGEILQQFTVSGTISSPPAGFMTGSKRVFIGAHRTNFTGAVLQTSDVKVNSCRYWLDYIEDEALAAHVLDTENHGALQPHLYAYPFNPSASFGDITKFDTLVFNWEFLNNTGSDSSGRLTIDDISSGSVNFTRFGDLGNILNKQYTARGDFFKASSTSAIDKDYVVSSKLNLPENIQSIDMVRVLSKEDQDVFTTESRPINYYFAFEKSMYQTISEEIINYFANLKDLHNLIGDPVERYRPEYKQMKFMRQKFFEKVANTELDFDKFYEFYKWFDSALSVMLGQLVPASADFADNVRTMIESHVLERSKYRNIFPFLEKVGGTDIAGTIGGGGSAYSSYSNPDDLPQGNVLLPNTALTKRQIGASNYIQTKNWDFLHAPIPDSEGENKNLPWQRYLKERKNVDRRGILAAVRSGYNRRMGSPVKFEGQAQTAIGGVSRHRSNKPNFVFEATQPYGPVVFDSNIPQNIMLSFDTDVEQLIDTPDIYFPNLKQRLGFGMNPSINKTGSEDLKFDGNMYAPFSLYSSSVTTGYNSQIVNDYKEGVMVTNLHSDFVDSTDVSLQGPFPEKFVGGRGYRHTELNDGTDTRENRAEGFRITTGLDTGSLGIPTGASGALGIVPPNYPFADTPAGTVPLGWLADIPTAQRFRDEVAKRPVNIKNILMTTASVGTRLSGTITHNAIGNYQKNYQVIQTAGRSINDPFFQDQSFNFAPYPETQATRGRAPLSTVSTENVGGALEYELPNRTGANSNQTVFVNLFSAPGSYNVLSRGYLDPAHEELSVYNASPYRNLSVISYGLSGSASVDPTAAKTITVVDQIGKNRGLNQRASLHCGPFGSDAAYGSVPEDTYVTVPSWTKTNRNPVTRLEYAGPTGSQTTQAQSYDNLFVQHAIPRSLQQYTWVTGSLISGDIIYGNSRPSCFSASVLDKLIISGSTYSDLTFVGLNTRTIDPVSASSHIVGFPLSVNPSASYSNSDYWGDPTFLHDADYFNFVITSRNGPFGYPTWKQIRAGETKIGRKLRETNKIGYMVPPKKLLQSNGIKQPTRANAFVDFSESPISVNSSPITFMFEDNTATSNVSNNIIMTVPFRNEIDYFSHNELNNFYGLKSNVDNLKAYRAVLDYTISSSLSVVVSYSESLYPSDINMFDDIVRRRTNFTITNIWDDDRTKRSDTYGGNANSQGIAITSASIWPLDGHLNFATTSSVRTDDGAGELMNSYSRYSNNISDIRAAATYATRVPAGSSSAGGDVVFAGDALWEAGAQSGKKPYESYSTYAEKIALVGKDHSIVPEFRISEFVETYVEENEGDFLADINNIFNLTGASISDSSQENFFKTYTNSDFLKYFSVVDEDLNDQRSGNLKINRDKVSLTCKALLKFLPYKGFYPAERTLELATIFSQSYGSQVEVYGAGAAVRSQSFRTLLEPLLSPGILYNTIKSGIGVSSYVLANTGSVAKDVVLNQSIPVIACTSSVLFEGTVNYSSQIDIASNAPGNAGVNGYYIQKMPFESLYRPLSYFNENFITGSGAWYDTGVTGLDNLDSGGNGNVYVKINSGKKLYELAIDNFLCETSDFFTNGISSITSKREDQFGHVVSGSEYRMRLRMSRTLSDQLVVNTGSFNMYSREGAFGSPLGGNTGYEDESYFEHVTPPYWSGSADVEFVYTAQNTGVPTLDEILSNTYFIYSRDARTGYPNRTAMYMDSCFNFTDYISEVPIKTTTQQKRWLIQPKFETPILNFASVSSTKTVTSYVGAPLSTAEEIKVTGMWHQYGSIPTGSDEGVFYVVENVDGTAGISGAPFNFTQYNSLADVVGIDSGIPQRLGSVKNNAILEEAVIAVPFKTVNNRRKFFSIKKSNAQYKNISQKLEKYVFPPKFDFVANKTVNPFLMYAFEFSATITQQDIADMWQNLPPNINEKFEQKEVVIDDKQVLDLLVDNSEDIQWLVFKVKKRAKKSFEKYRRSLVTEDTTGFNDNIGPYTYNWPYDYFSLVELVKIDETVQYASKDVLAGSPVIPTGNDT